MMLRFAVRLLHETSRSTAERNACTPVAAILLNIQNPASPSMLRNASWVVGNLCRNMKPVAPLHLVERLMDCVR